MKNEFVYGNGKVSFYDDKIKKMEQRDYQDNISEVLATENMIEELEHIDEKIQDKKEKLNTNTSNLNMKIDILNEIKNGLLYSLPIIVASNLLFLYWFCTLPLGYQLKLLIVFLLELGVGVTLPKYIKNKKIQYRKLINKNQKKLDGCLQEELSLNNMLTEYKNRLKRLLNDKSATQEEEMSTEIQTVHYQENLKRQRRYLELMKICGKNKDHFIESYQNETLVGALSEEYPEDEVNIIYGFAEDEAFKLSKQKH